MTTSGNLLPDTIETRLGGNKLVFSAPTGEWVLEGSGIAEAEDNGDAFGCTAAWPLTGAADIAALEDVRRVLMDQVQPSTEAEVTHIYRLLLRCAKRTSLRSSYSRSMHGWRWRNLTERQELLVCRGTSRQSKRRASQR